MVKTPPGLSYSDSHEWVRAEGDLAVIGITDFAQDQLTDVVYVELPRKGARLEAKKSFGVVESVKSVSDLYAPVSGEIVEVNAQLEHRPELVNDDPYGAGWLVKVRPSQRDELSKLLSAEQYQKVTGA